MKKLLLIATMLLTYGALNAQIAEVKQEGSYARIYDSKGSYTGNSISLGSSGNYVKNVSANAILIKEGSYTRYYDFKGSYTGNSTSD